MAKVLVQDLVVGTPITQYTRERYAETNSFIRSGVMVRDPFYDALASGPGLEAILPSHSPFTGGRQIVRDGVPFVANGLGTSKDIARIHVDGNRWGLNDLAKIVAATDPLRALAQGAGDYWANQDEQMVIASLSGMFASDSLASNRYSIVALEGNAALFSLSAFIDATQKLGDRSDELAVMAVDSFTEAYMRKIDKVEMVPSSRGDRVLKTYQGRELITTDGIPRVDLGDGREKVHTAYLFARGVFVRGDANLDDLPAEGGHGSFAWETDRQAAEHDTYLTIRRRFINHPRGNRFNGPEAASPDNAALATPEKWTRVWEPKNIRIVAFKYRLPAAPVEPPPAP